MSVAPPLDRVSHAAPHVNMSKRAFSKFLRYVHQLTINSSVLPLSSTEWHDATTYRLAIELVNKSRFSNTMIQYDAIVNKNWRDTLPNCIAQWESWFLQSPLYVGYFICTFVSFGVIARVNLKAMFSFVLWVSRIFVSIVLLFKNLPTGTSCSLFTDFAACSTPPPPHTRHASTLTPSLGRLAATLSPQDVVSQASKASPRDVKLPIAIYYYYYANWQPHTNYSEVRLCNKLYLYTAGLHT